VVVVLSSTVVVVVSSTVVVVLSSTVVVVVSSTVVVVLSSTVVVVVQSTVVDVVVVVGPGPVGWHAIAITSPTAVANAPHCTRLPGISRPSVGRRDRVRNVGSTCTSIELTRA
jgi:hypothetical protein